MSVKLALKYYRIHQYIASNTTVIKEINLKTLINLAVLNNIPFLNCMKVLVLYIKNSNLKLH